jgi:hypothetical protein
MKTQDFVSVPEAADFLGCSKTWVLKLLNSGSLKGFKLNEKAWAVDKQCLNENLKEYIKRQHDHQKGRPRSKFAG